MEDISTEEREEIQKFRGKVASGEYVTLNDLYVRISDHYSQEKSGINPVSLSTTGKSH